MTEQPLGTFPEVGSGAKQQMLTGEFKLIGKASTRRAIFVMPRFPTCISDQSLTARSPVLLAPSNYL